jgi:hypothetical protein
MRGLQWLRSTFSRRAAPQPDLILTIRPGSFPTVQREGQRVSLHLRDAESGSAVRIDFAPTEADVMGEGLRQRAAAAKHEAYQAYIRSQRMSHEDY